MRSNHTVRLSAPGRYASGFLVSKALVDASLSAQLDPGAGELPSHMSDRAEFVLTAAHFLRGSGGSSPIRVRGGRLSGTAREHVSIFGTDIGVLRLETPAPTRQLPMLSPTPIRFGQRTVTYGFGGRSNALVPKELPGRVLARVPFALSRNPFTRVRHGVMVFNHPEPAIRGDSGGPVLSDGLVYGLQSMITDPLGFNTRVATVAALAPHLPAIRRAMEQFGDANQE